MKNFIYLITFALLATSCSSILDEDAHSVAAETFYNTPEEAAAAVLAPLHQLRGEFDGMSFPTMQEASADYAYGRGSWTEMSDYEGLNTSSSVTRAGTIWNNLYGAVRDCNIAIDRLPDANGMNEAQKAAYIGELRFIRGFAYYYLVRLYGGCPLRTDKNRKEYNLAKSTPEQIYQFIQDDLIYAAANAPEKARESGTPTRYAASALLADVYLTLKKYDEAATEAAKVINSNKYALTKVATARDFDKVFGPDAASSEEVFYMKNENSTGNDGWPYVMICAHPKAMVNGQHMLSTGIGWYGIYTTSDNEFIKNWDERDLRKELNLLPFNFGLGDKTYLFSKYYDPNALGKNGAGNDWPVIRYPDVLLNYAEAVARKAGGATDDALEKLNTIRRRAYGLEPTAPSAMDYTMSDCPTLESFISLLVKEEGYECMNEAKRWMYLCRLGVVSQQIAQYKGKEVKAKHMIWPIAVTEFNYNSEMDESKDQNPGY